MGSQAQGGFKGPFTQMPRIRWSEYASLDMIRLYEFLAPKSEDAAFRAQETIRREIKELAKHPQIGRLIDTFPPEYRELVIEFGQGAYVARYRFTAEWVIVLAVRHGREVGY
jgi:plasmid stabilization system protein ParE